MKWIAAARVLATARKLLERVSVAAHRDVAQMSIPHQSQRFQRFFEYHVTYYYGVVVVLHSSDEISLEEAAKHSTAGSGSTVSTLRSIPERVIHTVWQAVAYPRSYKDVLGERFGEGDRLFLPKGVQPISATVSSGTPSQASCTRETRTIPSNRTLVRRLFGGRPSPQAQMVATIAAVTGRPVGEMS